MGCTSSTSLNNVSKSTAKITPVSFYTNFLSRPEHIPLSVFSKSVRLSKEGIERNKYNHHKGDAATRPPCLHERCENWKLDLCADCKADLGPERLAKEQEREKKNIADDHLPLVDFIAASESNLRQGVTTPYVLRKGGYFVKKFDSSYNNFFSVWEH